MEAGSGPAVSMLTEQVQLLLVDLNRTDHKLASRLYLDVLDSRHEHIARRISEAELITELRAVERHAREALDSGATTPS